MVLSMRIIVMGIMCSLLLIRVQIVANHAADA